MEEIPKKNAEQRNIDSVLARIKFDTAFLAALKRADNPATEYQSWEYLVDYGVDIQNKSKRAAYTIVLAALARAKPTADGNLEFGKAIACSFDDGNASTQARSRLRRLLACDSVEEVAAVTRSLLRLIESRGVRLSYSRLLNQLMWFNNDPQKIKIQWASSFFGKKTEGE